MSAMSPTAPTSASSAASPKSQTTSTSRATSPTATTSAMRRNASSSSSGKKSSVTFKREHFHFLPRLAHILELITNGGNQIEVAKASTELYEAFQRCLQTLDALPGAELTREDQRRVLAERHAELMRKRQQLEVYTKLASLNWSEHETTDVAPAETDTAPAAMDTLTFPMLSSEADILNALTAAQGQFDLGGSEMNQDSDALIRSLLGDTIEQAGSLLSHDTNNDVDMLNIN